MAKKKISPINEEFDFKLLVTDNARSVFNEATLKRFNEQNNKIASSIELIRSKVIIERVLKRLPLQVSYYSKGEILTNELYKLSPFTVEAKVKDSSILEVPIIIDFKSENTFSILFPFKNEKHKTEEVFKSGQWVSFEEIDFKVTINDYNTIKALQQDLSQDAFYFKINSLTLLAQTLIKELLVTP
ncbi:MAG: hypothetical protein IPM91_12795 [Bacteroidetes bacterium]|nr:hypothetical protein [Bacteroidota bacterium]